MVRLSVTRLLIGVLTLMTIAMSNAGTAAAAERSAIFAVTCSDSHRLMDDPIVHPGRPGVAHMHEFTGSWSTDAFSTVDSMRRSGMSCHVAGDTAGYWTPTMYGADGKLIKKGFSTAYFSGNHKDRTKIVPYPAGLKVIADMGDPAAIAREAGWHCGNGVTPGGGKPDPAAIPDCAGLDDGPGGIFPDDTRVEAKVVFPDCWDGVNLDSPDHRSHMSWADLRTGACPPSHPVSVPRLHLKSIYNTFGGPGITLSSGDPSTMHADFWNTWDQTRLAYMVKTCINQSGTAALCEGNADVRLENPRYPYPTAPGAAPFSFPPPGDTAKPVVTMNELRLNTKTFTGTMALNAAAKDNVAVSRVEYLIDGEEQYIDNTSPYSYSWDTRTVVDGCHTVQAKAVDHIGKTSLTPVFTVNTSNSSVSPFADTTRPTICLTAPAADATVKGTAVVVSAAAGDDLGVKGVQFRLDGVNLGSEDTTSAYKVSWNSTTAANGTHTLSAVARDAAGNTRTVSRTVSVANGTTPADTTGPTVAITAPAGGSTISGVVTETATAVDPPATANGTNIAKVEFVHDGALTLTDTVAPYSCTLDTRTLGNGRHTLTVRAYDKAGSVNSASASVTFTVSNTGDTTPPSVPTGLTAAPASSTSVNLAWDASTDSEMGVAGYNVLRDGIVVATPTGRTYTDLGRTASTTYSYTVQAIDGAQNTSASSAAVSATTLGGADTSAPSAPTDVTATVVSANQIDVRWNSSTDTGGSGLRGYNVYKNGSFKSLVAGTSYQDAAIVASTTYKYAIEAVDNAGNRSAKGLVYVTTPGG